MYILLSGMELTLSDIFVVTHIFKLQNLPIFFSEEIGIPFKPSVSLFESNVWVLLQSQTSKFVFFCQVQVKYTLDAKIGRHYLGKDFGCADAGHEDTITHKVEQGSWLPNSK